MNILQLLLVGGGLMAVMGVSDDDGSELAQIGTGTSLLGKFDLKSLLSKKEKGRSAKQSEPAE